MWATLYRGEPTDLRSVVQKTYNIILKIVNGVLENEDLPALCSGAFEGLRHNLICHSASAAGPQRPQDLDATRTSPSLMSLRVRNLFRSRRDLWNDVFPNIKKDKCTDLSVSMGAAAYEEFYKYLEEREGSSRMDVFLCPISREIMSEPVVASDGSCYDAKSIFDWIKRHAGSDGELAATVPSPLTGLPIHATQFFRNNVVRSAIFGRLAEFRSERRPTSPPPMRLTSRSSSRQYANIRRTLENWWG